MLYPFDYCLQQLEVGLLVGSGDAVGLSCFQYCWWDCLKMLEVGVSCRLIDLVRLVGLDGDVGFELGFVVRAHGRFARGCSSPLGMALSDETSRAILGSSREVTGLGAMLERSS